MENFYLSESRKVDYGAWNDCPVEQRNTIRQTYHDNFLAEAA